MKPPLIAPKPIAEFEDGEYHSYVSAMYAVRTKSGPARSPAAGLAISRTKTGKLSIKRSKARAFDYVTMREIETLAAHYRCTQADLWNAFRHREFIISKDRLEAEQLYAAQKEIPWK